MVNLLNLVINCLKLINSVLIIFKLSSPLVEAFNSRTLCSRISGLTSSQRHFCETRPTVMAAIGQGTKMAIGECTRQFTNHRWNCSSPLGGHSLFGQRFHLATKEAAFYYAITSAGITFTLARSCSKGNLSDCGCDKRKQHGGHELDTNGWKWAGCPGDIKYAMGLTRKFVGSYPLIGPVGPLAALGPGGRLTSRRDASSSRSLMNRHNSRAGRKAVKNSMVKRCKCHGVSGSCTTKTCWRTLASFQSVGDSLMRWYAKAKLVYGVSPNLFQSANSKRLTYASLLLAVNHTASGSGSHDTHGSLQDLARVRGDSMASSQQSGLDHSLPRPQELIYLDQSPNYCDYNLHQGSHGTHGRHCSRNLTNHDSCNILCCGRGYDTHQYTKRWQCQCKFVWCCYVQCNSCSEHSHYYTCK